jgi:ABC-type bacteriocin/lantibiotic exporter with double-glycine peptidase domain
VLLHVARVLYILVVLPLMLNYSPPLVLVVSGAALVAGLPEATAADRWARWVYYAAHLFWLFLVVMLWTYFVATLLP